MQSNIFIPSKIRIGYQERSDTYTERLAFVIYYDVKGKLRQETSWENWRQREISPDDFNNEPLDGFVLNKHVGDYGSGWNHRQSKCRVYDPRGFEFEITIENLLYILENSSSIKGKGLEGKFIYGWDGKDLVLIPEEAPEFKKMIQFTELQSKKISKKDIIPGHIYIDNKQHRFTYLTEAPEYDRYGDKIKDKALFVVYEKYSHYDTIDISKFKVATNEVNHEYANLMTKLEKEYRYNPANSSKKEFAVVYERIFTFKSDYTRRVFTKRILKNGKEKYNSCYISSGSRLKKDAKPKENKRIVNGKEVIDLIHPTENYEWVCYMPDSRGSSYWHYEDDPDFKVYSSYEELLQQNEIYLQKTLDLREYEYVPIENGKIETDMYKTYYLNINNEWIEFKCNTSLDRHKEGDIWHENTKYYLGKPGDYYYKHENKSFNSLNELTNHYQLFKKRQIK